MNYGGPMQVMHFPDVASGMDGTALAPGASLRALGGGGATTIRGGFFGGGPTTSSPSSLFFSSYSYAPQHSESLLEYVASWSITGYPSFDAIVNIVLVIIIKTSPIWYRLFRLFLSLAISYWCVAGIKPAMNIFGYIWTFITANIVVFYPLIMLTCIWGYSLTTSVVLILNGLGSTMGFNLDRYIPKWIGGHQAYKNMQRIFGFVKSARGAVGATEDAPPGGDGDEEL